MQGRGSRGFSLIELLVTLVIIGVLAAIIIPTVMNALDKSRQKRTMADLRLLGGGIETYSIDHGSYPVGDLSALDVLEPGYMDDLVRVDAWNHDLIYEGVSTEYTIGSPGKDGGASLGLTGGGGPTKNFNDDIIFRMGSFLQWPEGTQD